MVGCDLLTRLLLFIPLISGAILSNSRNFGRRNYCSPNLNVRFFFEKNPELVLKCDANQVVVEFEKTSNLEVKLIPPLCDLKGERFIQFYVEGCLWFSANFYPTLNLWKLQHESSNMDIPGIELNVKIDGTVIFLNGFGFQHNRCFLRTFQAGSQSDLQIITPIPNEDILGCPFKIKLKKSMRISAFGITNQNIDIVLMTQFFISVLTGLAFACLLLAAVTIFIWLSR